MLEHFNLIMGRRRKMMNRNIFITICIGIIMAIPGVVWSDAHTETEKKHCIYNAAIDQQIAFYQARLYLLDSEYRILSEIGRDAAARIAYLRKNKNRMVNDMVNLGVNMKTKRINCHINALAQREGIFAGAYPSPN